jgi:predicted HTH transcriptional regulator
MNYFDAPEVFLLKRTERKLRLGEIIITAMKELNTDPLTKSELQKLVKIRRKTFRRLLQELVRNGVIEKIGRGIKTHPFKYHLADRYKKK